MKLTLKRPARTTTIAFASLAAGMALTVPGLALAHDGHKAVPAPPAAPTSADQIQNIDQVKTAIKAYYGDTPTTTVAPGTATNPPTFIHTFNPDGAYAHEVEGIAARAAKELSHHHKRTANKAILFDIDDTTLNTYSYEIFSNFVYNPATNANFVNASDPQVFPAVPGMVGLEKSAEAHGYQVYFLTGRPITQKDGTILNLTRAGYDVDPTHVYLKDASGATEPWLSSCAPACTTVQYKSLTRQHIESLGVDIVANFGDQFSDLKGGFADSTYKIPNPMYYLP
ncbi:HAD family acid phosphatase [Nocardioides cynanchi]|uniref:HAD family acid phosphatase n=1 Tax=Nocardioides cynanchi TaxID=2558918 RepID=UPI001246F70F|nr:HAD family acid phosphatase [Nocardioides cynanchi]